MRQSIPRFAPLPLVAAVVTDWLATPVHALDPEPVCWMPQLIYPDIIPIAPVVDGVNIEDLRKCHRPGGSTAEGRSS